MGNDQNNDSAAQGKTELTREALEHASKDQLIELVLLLQEQNKQIAVLKARVAELERRLGLDSSNSSKPPSSDPPGSRKKRSKKNKSTP